MNTKFVLGVLIAAASSTLAAKENTLLVTEVSGGRGGGKVASVDIQSDGSVSAFQMRMNLPAGVKSVNTSRCLSELPKGFLGECKAFGNRVAVVVYHPGGLALPEGISSVGTVSYNIGVAKAAGAITVDRVVASSSNSGERKVATVVEAAQ